MSADYDTGGIFGTFPYESVITPATVAGLVITIAQYLLSVAVSADLLTIKVPGLALAQTGFSTEGLVVALIGSIATIGLILAILAIVVSGARTDVLLVGAILTYVAGLLSMLLASIYLGVSPEINAELLLTPLSPVIVAVGVGIGVNWIGVDVSFLD